ncbi:unnamed protein product [Sphenostylis stenocarpa]|uniref:HMA domain-containing protein n=1 Tax=Sphenostylis stenocarpa TaxID=92480 RepID=A0AA86SX17_9FABA|nr:unnamed protein product [Sphenostylis stenocarpa]
MDLHGDRMRQKAMKTASGLSGIDSVAVDVKDMKLVLLGDIDPVNAVTKLRKLCRTEIVSVGPAKEEKEEPAMLTFPLKFNEAYYPLYYQMTPQNSQCYCYDENPNGCVIC